MASPLLPPESYTARKLEHGTPDHLHVTSRRAFIGPIPEGWLKSHRKHWYRQYISLASSRQPSFRAQSNLFDGQDERQHEEDEQDLSLPQEQLLEPRPENAASPQRPSAETTTLDAPEASTLSLLHSQHNRSPADTPPRPPAPIEPPSTPAAGESLGQRPGDHLLNRNLKPRVTFKESSPLHIRARAQRLALRTGLRASNIKDGEILKMDKMLVRIDITQQQLSEYDEKVSQGVEARTMDKWREFMIVCRKHSEEDAEAALQLYQTRVIAATEDQKVKKRPKAQILLSQRRAKVNLFSSLDKTLCVWTVEKARTTIYYLKPMSSATSVEWYTFLRSLMGWKRAQTLHVNVPDLNISLQLSDPFQSAAMVKSLEGTAAEDKAIESIISKESVAAKAIIQRCMEMLRKSQEWADVLKAWESQGRIGLAWKRYDRLEWIHGEVEQKMYGTIAMAKTHDLQLRPKHHYPTEDAGTDGDQPMDEPPPVEGFLIRLTSQKGQDHHMGKMLFKRLYFSSQDRYLLFLRPAHALPPPPPKMLTDQPGAVPSSKQIAEQAPLFYDIDPYPVSNGRIAWLDGDAVPQGDILRRDREAEAEADRHLKMLLSSDGFVDLCDVKRVRKMQKGASPADANVEEGGDVDFDVEVPNQRADDGETVEVEEDRVFELLMKNGLVVRLQAFNKAARQQWMSRLQDLVRYWSKRAKDDISLYKSVREQNLDTLGIDERTEALVGQFAYKWEVSQSFASPSLYNVCGIASCRAIHLSGLLFRKPRRHTTFTRCHVILSHGHLLIYQDTLRKRSGRKLVHIHHERIASIDLEGCYIYSGLLTENDLLYQNRTFDSNTPGHHALPRIYLEDGWTSIDEDAMTTFVIWHSKSKSWFRSSQTVDDAKEAQTAAQRKSDGKDGDIASKTQTRLTRVGKLGATGRNVVFKARSRAERDHWVLAIQNEIERSGLTMREDVRVEGEART